MAGSDVDQDGPRQAVALALAGKVEALERMVGSRYGSHVLDECRALASQVSEETGLDLGRCYAGALNGAQYVADFRGNDSTRFYNCKVCFDTGWRVDESGPGSSAVGCCHACEKGLTLEAGDWLEILRPVGRGGKRYDSRRGREQFVAVLKHLPTRRERLEQRIQELESGGARQSSEAQPKVWD